IEAGAEIDQRNAKAKRSGAGIAIDAHEPGHCLEDRVVTRQSPERTVAPESRNAAMDQPGEARREILLIAEAPFLHAARLEILDQHIGALQQTQEHNAALGPAKIE